MSAATAGVAMLRLNGTEHRLRELLFVLGIPAEVSQRRGVEFIHSGILHSVAAGGQVSLRVIGVLKLDEPPHSISRTPSAPSDNE